MSVEDGLINGDKGGLLDEGEGGFEFNEQSVRKAFIRKVYSILTLQLLVTMVVMSIFTFNETVHIYTQLNIWPFLLALGTTIVIIIILACCPDSRRSSPINIILLGIFTISEGVLLGIACATYNTTTVFIAVGITAVLVFGLTGFAFQTKIDFTLCNGILFVALLCLILFGFVALIFHNQVLDMVYASIGAFIFGIYIVVDTQMMMGGNHKYSLSPEEYIFASLNLYLDIINMFLYILMIVSSIRN